ncbi:LOW QUALITY PROTEIN: KHDC3-like protein [Cricetulus griseus]|uniref:LOW QUALITY PROTEIN: KHDC3-like protein n=1 Tax=Cricetulus griseus TaxID=10029 RepID=UPI0015C326FE|nr:LOW QUALITY PROTEIN: KHDC3-like protein [Cricetulus griseus]
MTTFKSFKSLVQLQHKEGTLFEVVGDSSKLPKWFHTKYLGDPKAMYVDAWLLEVMFGRDGEYIPRVESESCTLLLQVNQWEPEEEAEIFIFGPPYYQKHVLQMISNLVDYFSTMQEEDLSQEIETQCLPGEVLEAAPPPTPMEVHETATQPAPMEVGDVVTQKTPMEVGDVATQKTPMEIGDTAAQQAPLEVSDDATQLAPVEVGNTPTQLALMVDHEASTQQDHVEASEAATKHTSVSH